MLAYCREDKLVRLINPVPAQIRYLNNSAREYHEELKALPFAGLCLHADDRPLLPMRDNVTRAVASLSEEESIEPETSRFLRRLIINRERADIKLIDGEIVGGVNILSHT